MRWWYTLPNVYSRYYYGGLPGPRYVAPDFVDPTFGPEDRFKTDAPRDGLAKAVGGEKTKAAAIG